MSKISSSESYLIWEEIIGKARLEDGREPLFRGYFEAAIFAFENLRQGLSAKLAKELAGSGLEESALKKIIAESEHNERLVSDAAADIKATLDRDSACNSPLEVFLFYKGFAALQAHRLANHLWLKGQKLLALLIQSHVSSCFGIDIHPAAKIGRGIMLDHATGLVIGETAIVGDAVSIMQSVTLGGTGKENGDRHPKIGYGVLIGPGAKILGNISVGTGAMIAASSVVLKPVSDHTIVAGVPAKVVGNTQTNEPSLTMDHHFRYNPNAD